VEHPTKPYRNLCSRCESAWCVWLGQGSAYQGLPINRSGCASILLHYYQSLPSGLVNTNSVHNWQDTHDHKHLILHRNRGPRGLCVIPQASTPEVIPVGDPPTPRHNVPTRHAASTLIHGGLDPTTTSNGYDCPIMLCEAT